MSKIAFVDVDDELQRFLDQLRSFGTLQAQPLDVTIAGTRVRGEIHGLGAECLLLARIASIKPKDHLRAWLHHVFLALARHRGAGAWPRTTVLLGRGKQWRLRELPVEVAEQQAALLLCGYREGLPQPLPFFEQTSHRFGERLHAGKDVAQALRAAHGAFQSQPPDVWPRGDADDLAVGLCWRGREPLEHPAFPDYAEQIWRHAHAYTEES